jgi:hypothetical protein
VARTNKTDAHRKTRHQHSPPSSSGGGGGGGGGGGDTHPPSSSGSCFFPMPYSPSTLGFLVAEESNTATTRAVTHIYTHTAEQDT